MIQLQCHRIKIALLVFIIVIVILIDLFVKDNNLRYSLETLLLFILQYDYLMNI